MSTRALIGYQTPTGLIKYVYCHYDGYPSYVGAILTKCYTLEKTMLLVEQGSVSVLGKDIGVKVDFNSKVQYDTDNFAKQCLFYHRDRGDPNKHGRAINREDYCMGAAGADYIYLLVDGIWWVRHVTRDKSFTELGAAGTDI